MFAVYVRIVLNIINTKLRLQYLFLEISGEKSSHLVAERVALVELNVSYEIVL